MVSNNKQTNKRRGGSVEVSLRKAIRTDKPRTNRRKFKMTLELIRTWYPELTLAEEAQWTN